MVRGANLGPLSPSYSIQPWPGKSSHQLQVEPSCCWGGETWGRGVGWGGDEMSSARRRVRVVARWWWRWDRRKGILWDGRDQAWVLDEGSGDVWPLPEEVSYATPSCDKVTPGWGSLLDHRPQETLTDTHTRQATQTNTHTHTQPHSAHAHTNIQRWRQAVNHVLSKSPACQQTHTLINPYGPAQKQQFLPAEWWNWRAPPKQS